MENQKTPPILPATLAERLRVLIIGIDHYPPLENGCVLYETLSGAVWDAEQIEKFFRENWQIPASRIQKLIAPNTNEPVIAPIPTYETIVKAFRDLRQNAHPGDPVWIHYSGHGGRPQTIWPEVKGTKGRDESLVPADIADPNGRYLRDFELAFLLGELVDAGLVVTLVLDCCHAGGAVRQRAKTEPRRRGSGQTDPTKRPESSLVASREQLARSWNRQANRGVLRVSGHDKDKGSGWLPEPRGFVLLAACQAAELTQESFYDGRHISGALSHFLLDELKSYPAWESTGRELYARLRARFHQEVEGQTPQLEGAGDRLLLGNHRVNIRPTLTVLETDLETRRVFLDAGQAHGLLVGSRVAVYPRGTRDLSHTDTVVATVELEEVQSASSQGLASRGDVSKVEPGGPAIVLGWGGRRPGRKIRLPEDSPLWSSQIEELCRHLAREEAIQTISSSFSTRPIDYAVNVEDGRFVLRGHDGQPLRPQYESRALDDPRAPRILAAQLLHLARFHDILELTPDPTGVHYGLGIEEDLDDGMDEGTVCLILKNESEMVLNVTVLELDLATFAIQQIYPGPGGAFFRPLEPKNQERIKRDLPTASAGPLLYKAMATLEPTSFRWLEMPPICRPFRQSLSSRLAAWGWTVAHCKIRRVVTL